MNTFLFAAMLLAIGVSNLGAAMVAPLLPVYATELGASGVEIGLIFASFSLSRSVFLPAVGELAERWGRRSFILGGLFLCTIVSIGLGTADTVTQIVVFRTIQGLGAAMIFPVVRSLIGDMTPVGYEGRVMGLFNAAATAGLAVGPVFGGLIKDYFGIKAAFYGMGLMSLTSLAISWKSLPRSKAKAYESSGKKVGVHWWNDALLTGLLVLRFGTTIGTGISWSFLPIYCQKFGLSATQVGTLITVTLVLPSLLQPYFGRLADRFDRMKMIIWGGVSSSICLAGLPLFSNFAGMLAINMIMGLTIGVLVPPMLAVSIDIGRRTGRMTPVISMLELAFSVGMVAGPILAGMVNEYLGLDQVFYIGGGFGLISCAPFFFAAKEKRMAGA
ncbi:MAG: MFS transporter [Deltaproteobacteria bacterium]|nr:MFS transporter [Deltaproteobacteria bacterium]